MTVSSDGRSWITSTVRWDATTARTAASASAGSSVATIHISNVLRKFGDDSADTRTKSAPVPAMLFPVGAIYALIEQSALSFGSAVGCGFTLAASCRASASQPRSARPEASSGARAGGRELLALLAAIESSYSWEIEPSFIRAVCARASSASPRHRSISASRSIPAMADPNRPSRPLQPEGEYGPHGGLLSQF